MPSETIHACMACWISGWPSLALAELANFGAAAELAMCLARTL